MNAPYRYLDSNCCYSIKKLVIDAVKLTVSKTTRINITLCDSASPMDAAIIQYLSIFRSGRGMHDRAFEIKRLLHAAILNEKHQCSAGYSGRRATSTSLVKKADEIQGRADTTAQEHRTLEIAQETKAISNGPTTKSSGVVDQSRAGKNAIEMIEALEKQTGLQIK